MLICGKEVEGMQYLTVDEVATRLKVSSWTVKRWLRDGELKGVRLGKNGPWRTSEEDLARFLEESTPSKGKAA